MAWPPAPEGAENQGLMLAIKAGAEYQNHLRKAGEAWPHLLVEQAFEAPPRLSRLDGLAFHLEFKLEYCRDTVDAGLDPRLTPRKSPPTGPLQTPILTARITAI